MKTCMDQTLVPGLEGFLNATQKRECESQRRPAFKLKLRAPSTEHEAQVGAQRHVVPDGFVKDDRGEVAPERQVRARLACRVTVLINR